MAECARCKHETGTARFCEHCRQWMNEEDARLPGEIAVWLAKWEAWVDWCATHDQEPR